MTSFKTTYGNSSWPVQPVRVSRNAQSFHGVALLDIAREIVILLEQINSDTFVGANQHLSLKDELRKYERDLVRAALVVSKGHIGRAGKLLGIKTSTLCEKMKRLEIDIKEFTSPPYP